MPPYITKFQLASKLAIAVRDKIKHDLDTKTEDKMVYENGSWVSKSVTTTEMHGSVAYALPEQRNDQFKKAASAVYEAMAYCLQEELNAQIDQIVEDRIKKYLTENG